MNIDNLGQEGETSSCRDMLEVHVVTHNPGQEDIIPQAAMIEVGNLACNRQSWTGGWYLKLP